MNKIFQKLIGLEAGDFNHIDGSLINHLKGTHKLLGDWKASSTLQNAGLYHAAYGTSAFNEKLVLSNQRNDIALIIGKKSENIVYQYCACDRQDFFSRIGVESNPQFRNRFTSEIYNLKPSMLNDLCELTAANEIEIAIDNPDFINEHGAGLRALFSKMNPYLSPAARNKVVGVFGTING